MRKIKLEYAFGCLLLVLFACEKVEKLDKFPLEPSKLVLNGNLSQPDNSITISKSLPSIDNANNKYIDDAEVSFYEDGELLSVQLSSTGEGRYYFPLQSFSTNKTYRVDVLHPDYPSITASTTIPKSFEIQMKDHRVIDSSNNTSGLPGNETGYIYISKAVASLRIADSEKNAKLKIIPSIQIHQSNGRIEYRTVYFSSTITGERIGNSIFLDGMESVNGLTEFDIEYSASIRINSPAVTDSIVFAINAVKYSEDLYQFEKTKAQFFDSQLNPFADPVQIYSNVDGGFGVLGGQFEQSASIRMY